MLASFLRDTLPTCVSRRPANESVLSLVTEKDEGKSWTRYLGPLLLGGIVSCFPGDGGTGDRGGLLGTTHLPKRFT